MLPFIRSLGRLSIRGYLIIAGIALISILATYSNLQDQKRLAAEHARQQAIELQRTTALSLQDATNTAPVATSPQTLSDTATKTSMLPAQSSAVAKARTEAGSLVFTPAALTLSLSHQLAVPSLTVSSPDGTRMSAPEVMGTSGPLGLTARNTSVSTAPSWQMQLSGQPAPGTYSLTLQATGNKDGVSTTYTGTLTVVVVL